MDTVLIRRVLEAAILAADGPVDRDTMLSLFDEAERPDKDNLNLILAELAESYAGHGIELREVASGFRFQVRSEMGPWVSRLWQEKAPRYSRAILETLALIAYRQPITRGEIEEIRGVAVNTQIIKTLLERSWVRVVGHRDVPGRPAMFASTRQFLDYFGLKSLEELPSLSEIRDLDKINEELELEEAALAMPRGEQDEEAGDETRQVTIMEAIDNNEPEIDESTLMSLEQVDSVLSSFESEFRRKPGQAEEQEVQTEVEAEAEPVTDEQESDSELFPDVDQNDEDLSQDDDVNGIETKHE
ncbi:MAG: SMC-Scp complex subunit ScpB [Alcanivoracaceae bacterium]|nr:SMC-Scp complex subunit ScpB [Alcanivoracaceae bacterium]